MTATPQLPLQLQAARLNLASSHPYLATALWALQPVESSELPFPAAVDQHWRLYYNPQLLGSYSQEEIVGVLYHEVQHLLRDHAARLRSWDRMIANIGGDAEINDDIVAEAEINDDIGGPKITIPKGGVLPKTLGMPDNLLAEEYCARLSQQAQQGQGQQGQGQQGQQQGQQQPQGQAQAQGQQQPQAQGQQQPQAQGQGQQAHGHGPCGGRCGSAAHGHAEPWEKPGDDASTPGISRAEAELVRRKVAEEILRSARARGNVPSYLERWAKEKLSPTVDWRRELLAIARNAMAEVAGAADYTYRRPSRRHAPCPEIILPSLRQPVPDVAIVVDTSESMGTDKLARALAEARGVLRALGLRQGVRVLATDAAVHTVQTVFSADKIKLVGGGGTDMGEGLEAVARLRPRPHVAIVLTDGYTDWPDTPPRGIKVIVALISEADESAPKTPSWARTVKAKV